MYADSSLCLTMVAQLEDNKTILRKAVEYVDVQDRWKLQKKSEVDKVRPV
jgi:hypothetical protein